MIKKDKFLSFNSRFGESRAIFSSPSGQLEIVANTGEALIGRMITVCLMFVIHPKLERE
jgi:hypothetical protein